MRLKGNINIIDCLMRRFAFSLLLLLGITPLCCAEQIDTTPVSDFELERYMGKWHEVARFDNRFERHLTDVTAEYSLTDDDNVYIINRGYNTSDREWQEAHGRGRRTLKRGRLKVSFFLFFANEYNVMELGDKYEWALVGSKTSEYLWILARTPALPVDTLTHIIRLAAERGYKVEELRILQSENVASR